MRKIEIFENYIIYEDGRIYNKKKKFFLTVSGKNGIYGKNSLSIECDGKHKSKTLSKLIFKKYFDI